MLLGLAVAAQADDNEGDNTGGTTLTVTVTATPTPTRSPTPTPTPSRSPQSSGSGSGSTVVVPGAPSPVPTPSPTDFSINGVLYVSGLTTEYVPSLNPLAGQVNAQFTVRNVSSTPISSRVDFWLNGPFGQNLSSAGDIDVRRLMPQEARVVDVVLTGPGQWTFTTVGFTLTPSTIVDGTTLEPFTREAVVFFIPWFVLVLGLLAAGIYAIVRVLRSEGEPVAEEYA